MKIILTYDNKKYAPEIRYTFDTLFSVIDAKFDVMHYSDLPQKTDAIVISYGKNPPKISAPIIHIQASDFFVSNFGKKASLPQNLLRRWNDLPIIYESDDITKRYQKIGNVISTNIDIIASSFFMLSRYEELFSNARDHYGRFPATESLAFKEDFLHRPVVDEYLNLIISWAKKLGFDIKRKRVDNHCFNICLTHDVDWIKKPNLKREALFCGYLILKLQPIQGIKRFLGAIRHSIKPDYFGDIFEHILRGEESLKFKSSFFFFGDTREKKIAYDAQDDDMKQIFTKLKNHGFEIGVHGGRRSTTNAPQLKKEIAAIKALGVDNVSGGRQHLLKIDARKTPQAQIQAGLKFDTTLGFAAAPGFRSGFAHPYHPYDFKKRASYDIVEIPLVVMEGTLCNYQRLHPRDGYKLTTVILKEIKRHNGCAAILWHPHYLQKFDTSGFAKTYWQVLNWIKNNNGDGIRCDNAIKNYVDDIKMG